MNEQERIQIIMKTDGENEQKLVVISHYKEDSCEIKRKYKISNICTYLMVAGFFGSLLVGPYFLKLFNYNGENGGWFVVGFLGIWFVILYIIKKRYGKTPPCPKGYDPWLHDGF